MRGRWRHLNQRKKYIQIKFGRIRESFHQRETGLTPNKVHVNSIGAKEGRPVTVLRYGVTRIDREQGLPTLFGQSPR